MPEPALFPEIAEELILSLEHAHPTRLPTITMSDREIWIEVGKHAVVSFLRSEYERQQDGETLIVQNGQARNPNEDNLNVFTTRD